MKRQDVGRRQAGLKLASSATNLMIAGAVGLTGAVTAVAAHEYAAQHPHTKASGAQTTGSSSGSSTSSSSNQSSTTTSSAGTDSGSTLSSPSQTPTSSSTSSSSQSTVVSGGS